MRTLCDCVTTIVELWFCFCVGYPHTLSAPAIWVALFVYESQVFVTWSLLGREKTLRVRMSVCVWRPLLFSAVVIWRISTCFLGAINLQGTEESSSFLTLVLSELCQLYCTEVWLQTCVGQIKHNDKVQYLSWRFTISNLRFPLLTTIGWHVAWRRQL